MFTAGDIVDGTVNFGIGAFIFYYLTAVCGLSGTMAGGLLAVSTVSDAMLDPLIGSITDNTRSRFGRRLPYMLIASVPATLSFSLLFSLPAGVWIDRRAHKRANMIVADVLRGAALATIPLVWWLGTLTIWHLLAVTFAVGALTVFFDLSSASFFLSLVHRSQFVDANSKISATRSLSYIGGPSIAGFLVHVLTAPVAGTVTELGVTAGQTVALDERLALVTPAAAAEEQEN